MVSILKWLALGYAVGIICMLYLLARSWMTVTAGVPDKKHAMSYGSAPQENWLGMILLSTCASFAWAVTGAGIYRLLQNHALFIQFSFALAFTVAVILTFKRTAHKLDKIIFNAIIILGHGFLIPYFF